MILLGTFHTNPQYRIHIEEADEDDEDGKTTIIVGLMQKDRRKMRAEGKHDLTIGYAIYEVIHLFFKVFMGLYSQFVNIWGKAKQRKDVVHDHLTNFTAKWSLIFLHDTVVSFYLGNCQNFVLYKLYILH